MQSGLSKRTGWRLSAAAMFGLIAALLLAVLLVRYVPRYIATMTHLRVAVAAESPDAALMQLFSDGFARSGSRLKLQVLPVASPADAALALSDGRAEFAVVRTDGKLPANGESVLILHHDALLLLAPGKGPIQSVSDLAHKTVGLLQNSPENNLLLDRLLAQFGVDKSSVRRVNLRPLEVVTALGKKQIDVVADIAPLNSAQTDAIIAAVSSPTKGIKIIEVPGAEAIANHRQIFKKVDIGESYYSGAPPQPDEDISVLGIDYLLMAQKKLPDNIVTDFTQNLFAQRASLAAEGNEGAAEIDVLDTDKGLLPILHPGAGDYYSDSQKSFMDRYGDQFYLIGILLSIVGSTTAGLLSLLQGQRRKSALRNIDELVTAKAQVAQTTSLYELSVIQNEIEGYANSALLHARDNNFDPNGLTTLKLVIDEVRKSIADRREALTAPAGPT